MYRQKTAVTGLLRPPIGQSAKRNWTPEPAENDLTSDWAGETNKQEGCGVYPEMGFSTVSL